MLTRAILTAAFVTISLQHSTNAQHPELIPAEQRKLLAQMQSEVPAQRQQAADLLRMQMKSLEQELIKIADVDARTDYQLAGTRVLAAKLLSDAGTHAAIPVLVRRIENCPTIVAEAPPPLGDYPYAMRLGRFRQLGVAAIFSRLRFASNDEISDKAIELYAAIIVQTNGDSPNPIGYSMAQVSDAKHGAPNTTALDRLLESLKRQPRTE